MTKEETIDSFHKLGDRLESIKEDDFEELCIQTKNENPWFVEVNIKRAIEGISKWLNREVLSNWLMTYPTLPTKNPKKVGLVLAGNIPMVGFHDVLCVLMSGNLAITKLSSKDSILMNFLRNQLIDINSQFALTWIVADRLNDIDAIIATGSDNSARYFNQYFSKYPHIIRKNRTSVAVLSGFETNEELQLLAKDVFSYFGLGCRNVTHLYLHKSVDPVNILSAFETQRDIVHHHKYANNYDYNRSIYLVNSQKHLASDFLLLKEADELFTPVANLNYSFYEDLSELKKTLKSKELQIQCIVTNTEIGIRTIKLGKSQEPEIDDYADGLDTMNYLSSI